MRGRVFFLFGAAVAVPLLAGEWTAIRLVPGDISLTRAGVSQQFLVLARNSSGTEEDVTAQAQITAAEAGGVDVDGVRNAVIGIRQGESRILAELGALRASTSIKVGDRPSEVGVRF